MKSLLAALLLLAPLPAAAATLEIETPFEPLVIAWDGGCLYPVWCQDEGHWSGSGVGAIPVPRFDSALGELVAVDLVLEVTYGPVELPYEEPGITPGTTSLDLEFEVWP